MNRSIKEGDETTILNNKPFNSEDLASFLELNSKLPGLRANLTLAANVANYFDKKEISVEHWNLLIEWSKLSAIDAPENSAHEFLPFCAIQALAAYCFYANKTEREKIMKTLRDAMNDSRWRIRESAAISFQRIGENNFNLLKRSFVDWLPQSNLLEQRAFLVSLAHTPILSIKDNALFALEIADYVMSNVLKTEDAIRKTEEFRVLSKGLEFTLSVIVSFIPDEGFSFLQKYAETDDKTIKRILKSNRGKSRLKSKYHEQVLMINNILNNQ